MKVKRGQLLPRGEMTRMVRNLKPDEVIEVIEPNAQEKARILAQIGRNLKINLGYEKVDEDHYKVGYRDESTQR